MPSDVILRKINSIQNCLQRIHDVTGEHPDALDDINVQDITVLNLQRAVQLCIDIAGYIITQQNLGLPTTLKDSFLILQKNNLISKTLADKMCKMVGFRNIGTNEYQALNIDILKSIIREHLKDFEEFYTAIL